MTTRASLPVWAAYLGQLAALALASVVLGRVGLAVSPVGGFPTLVWPPAGLCLAALVIGGYRLWPAIAAGALATNLWLGAPPLVAGAIATGDVLAAVLGAMALRRVLGSRRPFERCVEVLTLAVPAGLGSTAVSATVGTTSLALGGVIARASFAETWGVWWLGGLVSVIVVAPFLLTWWAWSPREAAPSRSLAEVVALGALLVGDAAFIFAQRPDALARMHVVTAAVLLPPVVWAAVRFRARGAATSTFVGGRRRRLGHLHRARLVRGRGRRRRLAEPARRPHRAGAGDADPGRRRGGAGAGADRAEERGGGVHPAGSPRGGVRRRDRGHGARRHDHELERGAERLYGYPHGEAIGRPISMLVPPEERGQLAWLHEKLEEGEEVVNHDTVRRCKGGGRIEVGVTLSPIRDAAGTVIGGSTIARDITECAERWRLASEAAHIGMWCWTMKDDRFAWTPVCRQLHGISSVEEGSYRRFVAAIHPDDRGRIERAVRRCIEEHTEYRVTYRAQQPDGSLRWISALGRALYDGRGRAWRMLGVAIDITAQKQAEEERAALLARERAARAEAESAARAKDEFLAILSHELRTPLQSMLGWALLLKGRPDDLPTMQKGLATIQRNVRTQAQLIEDLIDVSRIVMGKLRLEPKLVDLGKIVGAAIDSATVLADQRSIHIEATIELLAGEVLGDAQRLQQVVSNLLANAVKFTPERERVAVRLGGEGTTATLAVEDSGCGISPGFLPFVFDRFRQAEEGAATATTRRRGGLGLGLAIVRHLVEAHGGCVKAESPGEGRGATFTVTLPLVSVERRALAEERGPAGEGGARAAAVLGGVRVLVVDDDPDACDLLETVLQREGAAVHTVRSARAALAALASWSPDVLLSDIGMPEEDGYALIRELRARERSAHRHVPALALTAFASPADRELALSLGFEAHLAKPASPRDLAGTVANLVGRGSASSWGRR